ncbi:MAG: APC family permease, partial [Methanococcoides sp.]|nr:APC family permease [Methanococcoides sp.]
LFEAATATGSKYLIAALGIGTLFTCLASANGTVCDASRSWFALSRDKFLTNWFADVHPRYSTPYRAVIFTMPIAIAFAFSGFLDQVITFSIISGLICYVMIPFSLIRFRKLFPEHSQKVRPFVGPMQPTLAYITIFLAIVIMSTLNWGYGFNLIFGLLFYVIAYFYFSWRYKSIEINHDWGEDLGWPEPSHRR